MMKAGLKLLSLGILLAVGAFNVQAQDLEKGERLFRRCAACHTAEENGKNRIGPNLFGIMGQDIASKDGFRYSKALTAVEGTWTDEALDQFLLSPRTFARGTKMAFAGLRKAQDRANLIAWLKQQAPVEAEEPPQEIEEANAEAESTADVVEEDPDLALLPKDTGRIETYEACVSCHSIKLVVQQGMSAADWTETIDWMVDEQDMEELEPETQSMIVDYLAKHFGRERPNFKP